MSDVRPLNLTVDYLERYGSWCVILECPDGCTCGQRQIVPGFASRDDADGWAAQIQADWPSSPQAQRLRDRQAGS